MAQVDTEVPREFRDAARLLRKVVDETYALAAAGGRPACPGSPAEIDSADTSFDGAWGRPLFELENEVSARLAACADHMLALVTLTFEPRVVLAMVSVVRPCLENFALIHWLFEPGIDTRERVRRRMNLRLDALNEQEALIGSLGRGPRENVGRQILGIRSSAQALGYCWTTARSRKAGKPWKPGVKPDRCLDKRVPSQRELFQSIFADAAGEENGLGRALQFFTSSVLHGQLHGTAQLIISAEPSLVDGIVDAGIGLDGESFAQLYGAVLLAGITAMDRCAQYFGWDLTPWRTATHAAVSAVAPYLRNEEHSL